MSLQLFRVLNQVSVTQTVQVPTAVTPSTSAALVFSALPHPPHTHTPHSPSEVVCSSQSIKHPDFSCLPKCRDLQVIKNPPPGNQHKLLRELVLLTVILLD